MITDLPDGVLFARGAGPLRFIPTPLAAGPHSPDLVAGGALCALAGLVLEEHCAGSGALAGKRVARVTADFLAPARRAPLDIQCSAIKVGRRVAVHQVAMYDDDKLVCRVELLHLPSDDGPGGDRDWPAQDLDEDALWTVKPISPWNDGFFGGAAEVRACGGANGIGVSTAYLRLRTPVVDGHELSPAFAAVAVADNLHGMGRPDASPAIATVNPDVVVSMLRDPAPGWVRADIQQAWPGDGTGLSVASLTDAHGVFAVVSQTQVVG